MTVWMSLGLCFGNVVTSLAGMAALKHAVATSNVVWALAGVGCWVWTAMFVVLLLSAQPLIWVSLTSSCLSVLGSIALGTIFFGEEIQLTQVIGLILILVALVITSVSGT
ncbi:hypothetical protein [uncultured Roseobacter sp.]|uniref:hypothetical protein n=1 Tax=uncultured Roseobacter sp. TaxID=114847 RepID=UPI00263569B8|nr:hypothetical protein [uncultured Roseobacter sp.]